MKNKTKLQKFVALFSAMMLLVTSLGLQVFANGENATTYKTVGVERITEMEEWKVENGQAGKTAEGDLDGILLDGIYNFSGNGSINIGGGLWTGLMMSFDHDGMVFQYFNGASNTDFRGKVNISTAETGYTALFGTDMHIKMGFAFSERTETTANVVITITVGNATKELVLDAVDVSKFGRSLAVYAAGTVVTVKEAPKTYETLSVRDITGTAKCVIPSGDVPKSVAGSLEGVLLDGIYNFESGSNAMNIGGGAWQGIQQGFNGQGMVIQYVGVDSATFTPAKTGYTTMYGAGAEDMRIKMGFTFLNKTVDTADVTIKITVGAQTEYLFVDNAPHTMFKRAFYTHAYGGALTIKAAPSTEALNGMTVVTPADFGYTDGTYSSMTARKSLNANSNSAKKMTLDGKVLSVDMQGAAGSAIYMGNDGWTGCIFYTPNANVFGVYNNVAGSTIPEGNKFITASNTVLNSAFDKFNLKLSFEFITNDEIGENNDVKIGVWVNDYFETYYYDNNHSECYTANLSFYNGITISSPKREEAIPTDNTPYLLADFGVGDVTSSLVAKAIQPMSDGGSSINGKIALSEQSGMTLYGSASNEWFGLRMYMNGDKLELCHPGAGTATIPVTDVKANQVFTFTVAEKAGDWDNDGVANDVCMSVWIGGKLVVNFYLLEYKDSVSKTLLVYPYAAGATMTNYTDVVYANAVDGYVVEGEGTLTVNNTEMAAGTVLQTSGEYIVRCANAGAYVEYVAVYRTGDAHVDNVVDVLDLVAIRNASKGEAQPASKTGKKAADVDGSGAIDATDCAGVRNILAGVQ